MRAIETVLTVLEEVENGAFASETIRKKTADFDVPNRTLVTLLVYSIYRKKELWIRVIQTCLSGKWDSLEGEIKNALLTGAAGILEVNGLADQSLVNALVSSVKKRGFRRASGLVNAVLRKISAKGNVSYDRLSFSSNLEKEALFNGTPLFAAGLWEKNFGEKEAISLFRLNNMKSLISFRISPHADTKPIIRELSDRGVRAWISDMVPESLRFSCSIHPPSVPGFKEGWLTPQSESSIMAGSVFEKFYSSGSVLDMCAGRGIKTGQFMQAHPHTEVEAWEISPGKVKAFKKEMERLDITGKYILRTGDALELNPHSIPDIILLDAPCSGSGTWRRHPEMKWRLNEDILDQNKNLQLSLLKKALSIVAPGGIVVYSTCSLFRQENEQVVEKALNMCNNFSEIEVPLAGRYIKEGLNLGKYIWPGLPWIDGFYIAAIGRIR